MRLIRAIVRLGRAARGLVLMRLATRDFRASTRLARRATDRLETSVCYLLAFTPSRVPVCVRARWRRS